MPFTHTTWAIMLDSLAGRLDNSAFWCAEECASYINESFRMWQILTGYWRDAKSITTHTGVWHYSTSSKPHGLLKPLRVSYNSTVLDQDSLFGMDWGRHNWEGDTVGTPTRWFPMGINRIGVHPIPATQGTLLVEGLAKAPQYSSASEFVDIAPYLEDILLDYAQHIACFKQAGNEFASSMALYKNFLEEAVKQNAKFAVTSMFRRAHGRDLQANMRPVYEPTSEKKK